MNQRNRQTLETKNKDSNKYYDPPVRTDNTIKTDIERKRDKIQKSTIGGF